MQQVYYIVYVCAVAAVMPLVREPKYNQGALAFGYQLLILANLQGLEHGCMISLKSLDREPDRNLEVET